ncbi:hypothetical protein EDC96DRAFT_527896 [Choanephora cucurbitarum]|nr:hypothetical protein EDC96DRAFT_527896 [Choanephora cucurbitarum]
MYQTLLQDSYHYTHQQQMRRMSHEDCAYLSSDASFSSQENSPLNGNLDYYPSMINYGHMSFPQPTEKMYPVMYLASQSSNIWAPSMYQNYMVDPLPVVSSQRMTPSLSSTSSNISLDQQTDKKKTIKKMRKRPEVTHSHAEGTKQFSCDYENCGKVFRRSEHLKRHIKSIHTREKPYECPYGSCGKRFSRTDNLSQHIRIHRPKKTHQPSLSRKRTNHI